jgi:hypothetical protein
MSNPIARAPLTDEVEVVVIGGGWRPASGARLREAGIEHPHNREGRRLVAWY